MVARCLAAVLALIATAAIAVPLAPEQVKVTSERRALMDEFNAAMLTLGQQIMSKAPDRAIVVEQASRIHQLAGSMSSWFPAGSGVESGGETAALPAIWQKPDEFAARIAALSAASGDLAEFSKAGDLRQLMGKAIAVDRACVSCHQSFQKRD